MLKFWHIFKISIIFSCKLTDLSWENVGPRQRAADQSIFNKIGLISDPPNPSENEFWFEAKYSLLWADFVISRQLFLTRAEFQNTRECSNFKFPVAEWFFMSLYNATIINWLSTKIFRLFSETNYHLLKWNFLLIRCLAQSFLVEHSSWEFDNGQPEHMRHEPCFWADLLLPLSPRPPDHWHWPTGLTESKK